MFLDGYHLFDPFGFIGVRTCITTDHEIVTAANKIINELKNEIPEIVKIMGPKCKLGYCPEKIFCSLIKKFVNNYDDNIHSIFQ
jgi:thymidylate synthase ThyX